MITGIDKDEVMEYVSQQDKDKKNPTIFLLGIIDGRTKHQFIYDAMDKKGEMDIKLLQGRAYEVLQKGLRGIKNLNGKDYDKINDDVLDRLPLTIQTEVVAKLFEINFLSEIEVKN
ncbi:MAG: hypothetical protein KAX15_02730 [Candidatus Omnitrophica bacterium]|nr:hypothetical protein [Candidatus Omnitrophota bacterium]